MGLFTGLLGLNTFLSSCVNTKQNLGLTPHQKQTCSKYIAAGALTTGVIGTGALAAWALLGSLMEDNQNPIEGLNSTRNLTMCDNLYHIENSANTTENSTSLIELSQKNISSTRLKPNNTLNVILMVTASAMQHVLERLSMTIPMPDNVTSDQDNDNSSTTFPSDDLTRPMPSNVSSDEDEDHSSTTTTPFIVDDITTPNSR